MYRIPTRRSLAGILTVAAATAGLALGAGTPAEASIPGCLAGDIVGVASTPSGAGYWEVDSDGGVFAFGDAHFFGSMGGRPLNRPVVDIVATASGNGYWEIGADGGVFAFGDAVSPAGNPLPGMALAQPVVAAARVGATGLELTAGDGGVFALGGAPYLGSMGGRPLNRPVVDIVATASGNGYWEIGADGGVFAFGDAVSPAGNPLPGMALAQPVVAAARVGATGLELTAGDGGVFALGGAPYLGSMAGTPLARPISGIDTNGTASGYRLSARDGGLFAYGSAGFFGNAVGSPSCAVPPSTATGGSIVAYATAIKNGTAEPGWNGGAVPYSWGGGHGIIEGPSLGTCNGYTGSIHPCPATSTRGVDCSGFARWVYKLAYGRDVLGGGNTDSQLTRMHKVTTPQPGDLVFYGKLAAGHYATHHVGIYVGNGQMIDALKTGTSVRVDSVSALADIVGYWRY